MEFLIIICIVGVSELGGTHGEKSRFVTASHCIPKLTISGVVSDKEQKTISFVHQRVIFKMRRN